MNYKVGEYCQIGNASCICTTEFVLQKVGIALGCIRRLGEVYRSYRWVVLVLPLRDNSSEFRNYAEWGFDEVFGKPSASNEKAKGPEKSMLDEARAKFAKEYLKSPYMGIPHATDR